MRNSLKIIILSVLCFAWMGQGVAVADNKLRGPKGVDYGQEGVKYGPVSRKDTMWKLGGKFRYSNDVTIYQVMIAIMQKNADAFEFDNLNGLKTGSYLFIPSHAEVKKVDPVYAKQRADVDDELWVARMNGTLTKLQEDHLLEPIEDAKQKDVTDAKRELVEKITEVKEEQAEKLNTLQVKFNDSITTVETVLKENQQLQDKLTVISEELLNVKQQLGNDSDLQRQMTLIIDQQQQLLAQQREDLEIARAQAEKKSLGDQIAEFATSTAGLITLSIVPALLLLGGLAVALKKRNKPVTEEEPLFAPMQNLSPAKETPAATMATAAAAAPMMDDFADTQLDDLDMSLDDIDMDLDDSLDDDFDDSIQLDDDLELDEPGFDDDQLLDDQLDENDPLLTEDDEVDVDIDADNILAADDIDALLEQDDADDLIPEEDTANQVLSAEDIEELMGSEESIELDDDEVLDTGVDDVDAIMDELGISTDFGEERIEQTEDGADLSNADGDDELVEEDLLDSAEDDFDIDQILSDEGLQETSSEVQEPENVDADDVDALLDGFDTESELSSNDEQAFASLDLDEQIDDTLQDDELDLASDFDTDEVESETASEQDVDDIDALLAASVSDELSTETGGDDETDDELDFDGEEDTSELERDLALDADLSLDEIDLNSTQVDTEQELDIDDDEVSADLGDLEDAEEQDLDLSSDFDESLLDTDASEESDEEEALLDGESSNIDESLTDEVHADADADSDDETSELEMEDQPTSDVDVTDEQTDFAQEDEILESSADLSEEETEADKIEQDVKASAELESYPELQLDEAASEHTVNEEDIEAEEEQELFETEELAETEDPSAEEDADANEEMLASEPEPLVEPADTLASEEPVHQDSIDEPTEQTDETAEDLVEQTEDDAEAMADVYPEFELDDVSIDDLGDDLSEGVEPDDSEPSTFVDDEALEALVNEPEEGQTSEQILAAREDVSTDQVNFDELLTDTDDSAPLSEEALNINQLESADFDQLLSELSEQDEQDNHQASNIDTGSTADALGDDNDAEASDSDDLDGDELSQAFKSQLKADPDFVDVDSLMDDLDDDFDMSLPEDLDIDVGLDEFEELASSRGSFDVDKDEGPYADQLNLARTYIEMGDEESAQDALKVILDGDDEQANAQAQAMMAELNKG